MTTVVAPCITVETEEEYKATVERLHPFAKRVHIDLMDGEFAPTFSVGVDKIWWPQEWEVDIHAMVARPSEYVNQLIALKPKTIIFHAEVQEDLGPILQKIRAAGIRAGVALLRPTVPASVTPYIMIADHVLVFSGDLGHYGGTASLMQLEKVRLIHAIRTDLEIGWDGGANVENAYTLAQGGVNVINAGGAVNKSADPVATYNKMVDEINKRSVI